MMPMLTLVEYSQHIVGFCWVTFLVVWAVGAFRTKRSSRRQSLQSILVQRAVVVLAVIIAVLPFEALNWPFLPSSPAVTLAATAATVLGVGFAIWARVYLGSNWSMNVTVKAEHTLVRGGPYAWVRHPIYTGMILGLLGTAAVHKEVRYLLAAALIAVMFLLKIAIEERFMAEEFGEQYATYRHEVKALIPFVW